MTFKEKLLQLRRSKGLSQKEMKKSYRRIAVIAIAVAIFAVDWRL